ncbi:MAG: peptide deformylase [Candidatus Izemoplasmatales bacterium]|nr:peptide deformylase [Candidatus Izemoplasmatales bacterium]MDD5292781.1 peptide deformylase [Candidatus Izemoplasmatales bacterium]
MLTMKDVIQEGNPILRKRATPVALPLNQADLHTLRQMMEYIKNSQDQTMVETYELRPAVGLSAPQIALSQAMFCIHTTDETGHQLHSYAIVNPKILSHSVSQTYLPGGEGCLSVDEEKNGLVPRAKVIKARVHSVDLETGVAQPALLKLEGFLSIVFQHEYDHLRGVLFVDKVQSHLPGIEPIRFASEPE